MDLSQMDVNELVTDFNSVLKDFAYNFSDVCPDSMIGRNIKSIERAIDNPANRTKFIDTFVTKVLIYKDQIDRGEEDFFLGKSYDQDLDNDSSLTSKVFEFKQIWKTLKKENKDLVIMYMKGLCDLANAYYYKLYC